VVLERMKRKYGAEVDLRLPRIPYRETIKGSTKVQGRHKKQTGGRGQFADTWIEIKPRARGEGYLFVDRIVGGSIPRQYIPAVDKGVQECAARGVLAGYPVVDFEIELIDGKYHDVDSSEMAFKIAGSIAFKDGALKADPVLLEPIMKVEVVTPEEYMGDIIGDLNSRRGQVGGMDSRGNARVIDAMVPLANMFGYVNNLRSLSQGRSQYTMHFDHYEEVPQAIADEVRAKLA